LNFFNPFGKRKRNCGICTKRVMERTN